MQHTKLRIITKIHNGHKNMTQIRHIHNLFFLFLDGVFVNRHSHNWSFRANAAPQSLSVASLTLHHVHGTVCLTHYTICRLAITLRNIWNHAYSKVYLRNVALLAWSTFEAACVACSLQQVVYTCSNLYVIWSRGVQSEFASDASCAIEICRNERVYSLLQSPA